MRTETDEVGVDLADPCTFLDPDLRGVFARLRRERPVYWNPGSGDLPGFWALSCYADVVAAYRDNTRLTSEYGNVLSALLRGFDPASGQMIAVTDGPRHRAIRNLMLESFSPRLLSHVAEQVEQRTKALLGHVLGTGTVDFVTDVADTIPINTIGDLMNIPAADRPQLVEWNNQNLSQRDDDLGEGTSRTEILLYFADLAERRRREPGTDVVSALALGLVNGQPLTDEEVMFNCYSLVFGADESSRTASIGAVIALARHPDQWRALREGDVSVETATEEVLRWISPAMHFGRRAVTDVPIRDQVIRAGDVVTMWNTSANLDEEVFPDAGRFDLARTPNKHLTFGYGPHFCLGAFVGRVHVSALLRGLRELVRDIELVGEPERQRSNFLYGYRHAPVVLSPGDPAGGTP